jgi:hypothetical protein
MHGNHIYTLNHDLNRLAQKESEEGNNMVVNVPFNFKINYDTEPLECRMIETIDDFIAIVKEHQDTKETVVLNLILRGDNLNEMTINLIQAGYIPEVKNEAGRISLVIVKLRNVIMIVKTQQLVPDIIDGMVNSSSDVVYNKMSLAMFSFGKRLFARNVVSNYTNNDIMILNEYRTIVPNGAFKRRC